MPVNATDHTFDQIVADSGRLVLVDFWADWCTSCRAMSPILDQVEAEHPELTVVKIDAEAELGLRAHFKVTGLPAMHVLVDGQVVKSMTGPKPKPVLLRELQPWLAGGA